MNYRSHATDVLRRCAAILVMLWFVSLGTGLAQYFHELQHQREDAVEAAAAKAAGRPVEDHDHDDNNCPVHAQLHLPLLSVGWVPLLVWLGIFVAFLTELAPPLVSQRLITRLHCRGPPVAWSFC